MDVIKTGQADIDQCVEEIIEILKKHGMRLHNTELVLNKVNLADHLFYGKAGGDEDSAGGDQ